MINNWLLSMNNKLYKILLIIVVVAITLTSVIYLLRTTIDIGCAKTNTQEGSLKRRFMNINCWFWERSV